MEIPWGIVFSLVLLVHGTTGQADSFYEPGDAEVSFLFENGVYTLDMNESNEGKTIVLFRTKEAMDQNTVVKTILNYTINDKDFVVTGIFDYEILSQYFIQIFPTNQSVGIFSLNLNDLNDEPPSLLTSTCKVMENDVITAENSDCEYTISDKDGNLQEIAYKFNEGGQYFKLAFRELPAPSVKDSQIYLISGDNPVDYETVQNVLLNITVNDGVQETETSAMVIVADQNDNPPKWVIYSTNERFPEEQEFSFTVEAIDGDIGINDKVTYGIVEDSEGFVNIDSESGEIKVKAIDRDQKDLNEYNITVQACEASTEDLCTSLLINFFIEDINDNPPIITVNESIVEDKFVNLSIPENSYDQLLSITVTDADFASNAQFKVVLEDTNAIKYSEAFQIIPSGGYEEITFNLLISKPENLDYENEDWRTITFNIVAFDPNNDTLKDTLTIVVNLENIYDEFPTFDSIPDTHVQETIKKGEQVTAIIATAGDANDEIKYEVDSNLLECAETDPKENICNLQVATDNAFDYNISPELTVQITATGKSNKPAQATFKIIVEDVNNKPPIIETGDLITINENTDIDTIVPTSIKATDPDSTADLSAQIDWSNSYATKNDVKLTTPEDYTILELHVEKLENNKDITLSFKIIKEVDFEKFDTLVLKLDVTDQNTAIEEESSKDSSVLVAISIIDGNDKGNSKS